MKVIKADLPQDIDILELHTFADEHIGDACCDLERLKERIDYVANTPNAYCIMNGDILDYASRSSIGDIETREFNIMGQLEKAVELFGPIKDKILAITNGNHENRGYRKEGVDISKMIAMQLDIADRYTPAGAVVFLRFGKQSLKYGGRPMPYVVFINHGSGGGRKEGAKAPLTYASADDNEAGLFQNRLGALYSSQCYKALCKYCGKFELWRIWRRG